MRNQGIGSWPARRARMAPARIAMVYEGREWTYRDLHERATRFAHALAAHGVRRGDRIAYLGPNHPTFLEVLFGTDDAGRGVRPAQLAAGRTRAGPHPARQRNPGAHPGTEPSLGRPGRPGGEHRPAVRGASGHCFGRACGRTRAPGRDLHDPLYLGHHRQPEGGNAHPRQHRLEQLQPAPGSGPQC